MKHASGAVALWCAFAIGCQEPRFVETPNANVEHPDANVEHPDANVEHPDASSANFYVNYRFVLADSGIRIPPGESSGELDVEVFDRNELATDSNVSYEPVVYWIAGSQDVSHTFLYRLVPGNRMRVTVRFFNHGDEEAKFNYRVYATEGIAAAPAPAEPVVNYRFVLADSGVRIPPGESSGELDVEVFDRNELATDSNVSYEPVVYWIAGSQDVSHTFLYRLVPGNRMRVTVRFFNHGDEEAKFNYRVYATEGIAAR